MIILHLDIVPGAHMMKTILELQTPAEVPAVWVPPVQKEESSYVSLFFILSGGIVLFSSYGFYRKNKQRYSA
jgi:hypothetical protein